MVAGQEYQALRTLQSKILDQGRGWYLPRNSRRVHQSDHQIERESSLRPYLLSVRLSAWQAVLQSSCIYRQCTLQIDHQQSQDILQTCYRRSKVHLSLNEATLGIQQTYNIAQCYKALAQINI